MQMSPPGNRIGNLLTRPVPLRIAFASLMVNGRIKLQALQHRGACKSQHLLDFVAVLRVVCYPHSKVLRQVLSDTLILMRYCI